MDDKMNTIITLMHVTTMDPNTLAEALDLIAQELRMNGSDADHGFAYGSDGTLLAMYTIREAKR